MRLRHVGCNAQVLAVGDFFQLPPVAKSGFAFSSWCDSPNTLAARLHVLP